MEQSRVLRMPTGETITILRTGAETGGAVFEVEAALPPRLSGPPAHRHLREEESFEVLEGRLLVRMGSTRCLLGPGETATARPGTVHAFGNPTDEPTRIRTTESPAGQLEPQFRVLVSSTGPTSLLRIADINVRHDLSFLLHGIPSVPQRLLWRVLARMARLTGQTAEPLGR